MDQKEKIRHWQERLEATFSHKGIVGGRFLRSTMDTETKVGGEFWEKFVGHRVLTDSFLEFFGETLDGQWALNNRIGWPQGLPHYAMCLTLYLTIFRTIRSTEILSAHGYTLQAYAMQRGIKEQLFVLCGVANKMEKIGPLFGRGGMPAEQAGGRSEEDMRRIVGRRRKMEGRIRDKIIARQSGLSAEMQTELLRWEGLFNWEAHRSLLSFFVSTKGLLDGRHRQFELGPVADDSADAMFLNRSMELNWMTLRLIPFMRRADTPVSADWSNKWNVLEESFEFMFEGFLALGKKIAPAFRAMLESKFKFDQGSYYAEIPEDRNNDKEAP